MHSVKEWDITSKNFIISAQQQVEMFADAIEASANDRTPRVPINFTYLQGAGDIIKFMEKRKKRIQTANNFIVLNTIS